MEKICRVFNWCWQSVTSTKTVPRACPVTILYSYVHQDSQAHGMSDLSRAAHGLLNGGHFFMLAINADHAFNCSSQKLSSQAVSFVNNRKPWGRFQKSNSSGNTTKYPTAAWLKNLYCPHLLNIQVSAPRNDLPLPKSIEQSPQACWLVPTERR